jgi:hypothetical protein
MEAAAVDYDTWLEANGGAYCFRHRCRMTANACQVQQQHSRAEIGDMRCHGCGGLDNQPDTAPMWPRLQLVDLDNQERDPAPGIPEQTEPATGGGKFDFSSLALDLDPSAATALLEKDPELSAALAALLVDDDEPDEPVRTPRRASKEKPRRVAVYMGRCNRCQGYMINDLERYDGIKDDDVYRCCTCGWRTSPDYDFNRKNPKLARAYE